MSLDQNQRIALMEQSIKDNRDLDLIESLNLALEEYEQQINKKSGAVANNPSDKAVTECLNKIESCLRLLKWDLISATPDDKPYVWKLYLPEIKATSQQLDQLVRTTYLPTRLNKIYETIKTLLRGLVVLFAPLEGTQLINKETQTLTSSRSALFHQIEVTEKHLNSLVIEPAQTKEADPSIEIHRSPIVPRIYG